MMDRKPLTAIRQQIDSIDDQLFALISQRAQLALETAKIKQQEGGAPTFYRPEREAQILRRIMRENTSPLSDEILAHLFREIIASCLALQKQLAIAFLGPLGTFSQAAAEKHFSKTIALKPVATINQVFREVEAENANYGVVPIENSLEGKVNQTLDLLVASPLKICGEVELAIHQHLLRHPSDGEEIKCIYSHQQSFAQCRQWLEANYPTVKKIPVNSTAQAAQIAATQKATAAIGSDLGAQIYGLQILAQHIEDAPQNTTRFLIIGRQTPLPSGNDKTSLLISGQHKPGFLFDLLRPFSQLGINLTSIESRPAGDHNWRYLFFIDLEGHQEDANVRQALAQLEQLPIQVKVLGSYSQAVL